MAMLRQCAYSTIIWFLGMALVWAVPDQTMSVTPSATAGATITAADENTRNSNISTPFNAHSHTDITQTGTPLNVGASSGRSSVGDASIVLEGATNNGFETTLTVTDPTADRTITFSNETGTVVTFANANTQDVNLIFEGATADAFETTLTVTDPTADRTITIPDVTGTVSITSQRFAGGFTRDTTLASGTQAITGVGFSPTLIAVICAEQNSDEVSWGFSDGTTDRALSYANGITVDTFANDSSNSIADNESSGVSYLGDITTLGSDGFTITWTKNGTPSGTLTCHYTAIR